MRIRLAAVLVAAMVVTSLNAQEKRRVAVLDFDYATVYSSVAAIFGSNIDVGKGVADMLVNELVTDGRFSVIERSRLDAVLKEQNFSNSNRADASTAAQIGRVLGVDAIIVGSITQFGRDDQSKSIGGLGAVGGRFGIGGIGKKKAKAVVGLTSRVIDINTAEILAVASGKGESTRSGTHLLGGGAGGGNAGGGAYDMSSSNFGATILGEATSEAVKQLSTELEKSAGILPAREIEIEGLVADATGGVLIMNVGTQAGVKVGDQLEVRRVVREVKDPASGAVLRKITEKVGIVTITEADGASSVGTVTGGAEVKVGDMVKNP